MPQYLDTLGIAAASPSIGTHQFDDFLVESSFCTGIAVNGTHASREEDEWTIFNTLNCLESPNGVLAQGHLMRHVSLHSVSRDEPSLGFEIKFGPAHGANPIATLCRCDEQFDDRAERPTDFVASPQYQPQFIGTQHAIATDGSTGRLDPGTWRMHEGAALDRPRAHLSDDR
jgi:hypothetical protein